MRLIRQGRDVLEKNMLTAFNREHARVRNLSKSSGDAVQLLYYPVLHYGLGESGKIGTPLFGLGESGKIGTPLFGLGESGKMGTPLLGFGESGKIGTPLA